MKKASHNQKLKSSGDIFQQSVDEQSIDLLTVKDKLKKTRASKKSFDAIKKSILSLPPIRLGEIKNEQNRQNAILVKKMIAINQREPDIGKSEKLSGSKNQKKTRDEYVNNPQKPSVLEIFPQRSVKGHSQHVQKMTKKEKKLKLLHEQYAEELRKSYEVKEYKKPFQFKKFDKSILQMKRYNLPLFDETSKNLQRQKVYIFITVQELEMFNFIPQLMHDMYFFELKISSRNPRKIIPETYENFTKSVINEFFSYEEVVQSRIMYVGVFLIRDEQEKFLADFELDITPYFLLNGEYQVQYDLRNLRELWSTPHYMQKDLRKRGTIKFNLKITSRLWNFLLPAEKQKNSEFQTEEFFNQFKNQD